MSVMNMRAVLHGRYCETCGRPLDKEHRRFCSWECFLSSNGKGKQECSRLIDVINNLRQQGVRKVKLKELFERANLKNTGYSLYYLGVLQERGEIKLVMNGVRRA